METFLPPLLGRFLNLVTGTTLLVLFLTTTTTTAVTTTDAAMTTPPTTTRQSGNTEAASSPLLLRRKHNNKKDLQKISILASGSRGDIQPYIALGAALRDHGYTVRILTNEDHASFVKSFHLDHVAVFGSADTLMKKDPNVRKAMAEGNVTEFMMGMAKYSKENQKFCKPFYDELVDKQNRPDLLISVGRNDYAQFAMYTLNIPLLLVPLQTIIRRKRAPVGLRTYLLGLHEYFGVRNLLRNSCKGQKAKDDILASISNSLPLRYIIPEDKFFSDLYNPMFPVFVCQSPIFKHKLHNTFFRLHNNYRFVGNCVIKSKQEEASSSHFGGRKVRESIEKFLQDESNNSSPPVYCGWGSMICKSPEYMVELVVRALQLSGQRGIVLGGWAGLDIDTLRRATDDDELISFAERNVLFVEEAPHEWLFQRVACTVHHGGLGTVTAALRSGVPTVVAPVYLDQFDNSNLVNQLGVGIGLSKPFQKTTSEELAAAIKRAINSNRMKKNAKNLSEKLLKEDGTGTLVTEVTKFWEKYVQTGILEQKVYSDLDKAGCRREGNRIVRKD